MKKKVRAILVNLKKSSLRILRPRDAALIDVVLRRVGTDGEVHLVLEHGRLRHIRAIFSEMALGSPSGSRKVLHADRPDLWIVVS